MQLKSNHKSELLGGEWLNDCHIHAAQQLIPLDPDLQHTRGLQDSIFGQSLRFDVMREEMVQILHSGGNHLITVSTLHPPQQCGCMTTLARLFHSIQRSKLQLFSIHQMRK